MTIFNKISNCQSCTLCKNQKPILQKNNNADVFWVGLSAVQVKDPNDLPLSINTNTGKLINSIEFLLPEYNFHKTNLVKCLPLKENKIRYPNTKEMVACYPNLESELNHLNPKKVFLLGKQVAEFVMKAKGIKEISLDNEFNYVSYRIGSIQYIPIHHPSYILVYKRKLVSKYIESIETIIQKPSIIEIPINEDKIYVCEYA